MNEFTKEELQIIQDWSKELSNEYGTSGDEEEKALDKKIQSMIDAFPDFKHQHKWIARHPIIQVEGYNGKLHDYAPVIIRCKICGESYFS